MTDTHDPSAMHGLVELADLVERDLMAAFTAALNATGSGSGSVSVPRWRELAAQMRRGAELATTIGNKLEEQS